MDYSPASFLECLMVFAVVVILMAVVLGDE
jgi:hypothetical protein